MKTLSKGIGALGLGVLGLCPALGQDHAVSARLQRTFGEHAQTVWGVAFSPDGQYLASGSADGTVRLRRARDGSPVRVLNGALLQTLSGTRVTCTASPSARTAVGWPAAATTRR